MERAPVLIVGGGIIGSAVAFALAHRGIEDIVVVDLDLAGLYASSELNAGGARATWWQPVNIATCVATLDFFRTHRSHFAFRECGYLWLFDDEELFARARAKMAVQNGFDLGVESLTVADVAARFPLLDRHLDELVGATFSPRDGLINPNAVRQWYRSEAENRGVRFFNRHYVAGVTTQTSVGPGPESTSGTLRRVASVDVCGVAKGDATDDSGMLHEILTTHSLRPAYVVEEMRIACDVVVNCLGAWSPLFSAKIGVTDFAEPVRRQIALVDVQTPNGPDGDPFQGLGMVVDSSDLYFHPEGSHVLAGYSIPDEAPGFDFSYDGDSFFEDHIWPRLAHRSSTFERCGHVRGWSGLYAVTPDRSGIAGAVRGFSNLFEAHSFTGRGVMQSYGVACALAELIDRGRTEQGLLAALSRDRFTDPARWVVEDLHI